MQLDMKNINCLKGLYMKIAVFGPGAMGSIFAARFARAGHSVTLIARGKRLATLRARGLWMQSATGGGAYQVTGIEISDSLKADDTCCAATA